jgi:hypothetical protein
LKLFDFLKLLCKFAGIKLIIANNEAYHFEYLTDTVISDGSQAKGQSGLCGE